MPKWPRVPIFGAAPTETPNAYRWRASRAGQRACGHEVHLLADQSTAAGAWGAEGCAQELAGAARPAIQPTVGVRAEGALGAARQGAVRTSWVAGTCKTSAARGSRSAVPEPRRERSGLREPRLVYPFRAQTWRVLAGALGCQVWRVRAAGRTTCPPVFHEQAPAGISANVFSDGIFRMTCSSTACGVPLRKRYRFTEPTPLAGDCRRLRYPRGGSASRFTASRLPIVGCHRFSRVSR